MRNAYEVVLSFAAHDPLLALGLAFLSFLIVPLGAIHLLRVFAGLLVVLIREFKHEFLGLKKVVVQMREEFQRSGTDDS